MDKIRIAYADFWSEWSDENFIEPILRKHFDIIIDQINPDVLFHSIFGGLKESSKYNCKKIQFIGENRRPHPSSDFSISFDSNSDKNYQLPLWQVFILKKPEYLDRLFNRVNHSKFVRFASFVVSNPNNFLRNSAFQQLNNYKRVHSYGRYLTNDNLLVEYSKGKYWRDAKDSFFATNPHKFMIAFENNAYPHYTTEKLMDAFLAGSLPIYWGDPKVKEVFNKKAFINAQKQPTWLEIVKQLDFYPELFAEMYNEPIFNPNQKDALIENLGMFEEWLIDKTKS